MVAPVHLYSMLYREHANLLSCLPAASVFIQSVLEEGGKAFVHCSFGRSRSPSVTVSYLMKFKSFTFEEAMQLVKARRPVVSLNAGFLEQLRMYELSGFNIHHAQQLLLRKRLREFQVSLRSKDEDAAFEEASFCLGQSKNKLATSKIYQPVLVQVQYSKSCGTVMEGTLRVTVLEVITTTSNFAVCIKKSLCGADWTLQYCATSVRATSFHSEVSYRHRTLNCKRHLRL